MTSRAYRKKSNVYDPSETSLANKQRNAETILKGNVRFSTAYYVTRDSEAMTSRAYRKMLNRCEKGTGLSQMT